MAKFGVVPPEVPVVRTLAVLAPAFRRALEAMLADLAGGPEERLFETLRTNERQSFLYGFGRDYDDGRGVVTKASQALNSWHGFALAVDVVEKDATPWDAPPGFWEGIGAAAKKHGLVWGGDWQKPDRPHVQWGRCPVSPTQADIARYLTDGVEAVWRKYGAAA